MQKQKVIITGASGMVGEGVLWECLNSELIESILVIGRKPCGHSHSKLKEILISDFFNLKEIESQIVGYNAVYFCLGVSSIGLNETEYKKLTYDLTLNFAQTFIKLNPNSIFCYVSGSGTNLNGKQMWAKVKGRTENDLLNLGFKDTYNFRPGFMLPTEGLKNELKFYKYINWLYPFLNTFLPNHASTLKELAMAMIYSSNYGFEQKILEVKDIKILVNKYK